MTPEKKLAAARTALLWDHAFFGSLALQLELVEDNSIDTMATDGVKIYWCRAFVDKLTRDELIFVFVHEIMHCALEHMVRQQHREAKRWNVACDFAINGEIVDCKIGKMPSGGLIHVDFTGRPAEEIYALLPDDIGGGGGEGNGADPGGCGGVRPAAPAHDEASLREASAAMQVKVRQAAAIAAKAGNMPTSMQRLIDTLLAPVVDWRAVLRRFIDESASKDYSWNRPNRRFLSSGFILPGMIADGINHLVVVLDTSGSINDEALLRFASEINGAFGDGNIDKVTVIYADAEVAHVDQFERGDLVTMEPAGGGGTRFSPSFEWIARNAPDASAIIYFTDLYCDDFGAAPAAPVLWAVYGDSRQFEQLSSAVPFGESLSLAA